MCFKKLIKSCPIGYTGERKDKMNLNELKNEKKTLAVSMLAEGRVVS